jgi:hypothetical protein
MKLLKSNWLNIFLVAYGAFVFLPFLAPVFMKWNLSVLGRAIYLAYSFVCHQLPERSLFFFGPKLMYSVEEIQVAWQRTTDPLILRQFVGNPGMGWKVAWSDRMISMYGGYGGRCRILVKLLILALNLRGTPSVTSMPD